ncbi:MAG: CotH kinase family protein [Bacteroidota bacterium]
MRNATCLFLLSGLVYLLSFPTAQAQVVINEFMSSNSNTLFDEDGESSDWLELFNTGDEPVSLAGYYLSDDADELQKWPFPAITLSPKSYLLVFCSDKDRSNIDQPLHTNFKLSAAGEDILLGKENELLQHIAPVELDEDIAYAAFPDENRTFLATAIASPGGPNLLDQEVGFSQEAGFYEQELTLSLSFDEPALGHLEIRYTLSGDEPSSTDALFTNGITVKNRSQEENRLANIPSTPDFSDWNGEGYYPAWVPMAEKLAKGSVVKAAVFLAGQRISPITTQTYFVFPEGEERYSFPVVSLSCPTDSLFSFDRGIYVPGSALQEDNLVWSGNYFNRGSDWERSASLEYFVEGESVVNQTIGIRIHGGKTRGAAQKTLRLYARSSYGKKRLDYPFFRNKEQSSYKRLLLRTTMGAWTNTIFADVFAHQAARDLNLEIQEYQPVIVFINGEYWGIHQLREHVDEHKIAEDHGLEPEDITIYAAYGNVTEGEPDTEFIYLRDQYLAQNDITDPQVYDYIQQRFDIDQLIDYFLTEIFFNNRDWPANNAKMWRSSSYDNKFRWLFYDLDAAMGKSQYDKPLLIDLLGGESPVTALNWKNAFIRTLIKNETFKQQFISRAKTLLQETFKAENLYPLVLQMTAEYEGEMDEHFSRWANWQSTEEWQSNVSAHITRFVFLRSCELETQMVDFFGIEPFLNCDTKELSEGNIYPNPTNGIINIVLDIDQESLYFCRVYNPLGQLVQHQDLLLQPTGSALDLSQLPAGSYYLSLLDHRMNSVMTKQVIIQ